MGTEKAGSLLRTLSGDSLMTGTERKRTWRLANPERSRKHERTRAGRRRQHGTVTLGPLGPEAFSYPSGISYQRYESQGYMWFSREKGEWLPYYSTEEIIQRRKAGIGRPASRWRQDVKRRKKRLAELKARVAELGLDPDAPFEETMKKILQEAIAAAHALQQSA